MNAKDIKPDLIERFADNGEHSHWELRGRSGVLLWTEDEEEKEPIGYNGDHCKSCNGSGFGVIPDSACLDCNGSGTDFDSQLSSPPPVGNVPTDRDSLHKKFVEIIMENGFLIKQENWEVKQMEIRATYDSFRILNLIESALSNDNSQSKETKIYPATPEGANEHFEDNEYKGDTP